MICIYCHSKTTVINSRKNTRHNQTWRRRQCLSCHAIYTTRESLDLESSVRVKPTAKQLESLSRDRLFMDIFRSLSHRKTALCDAGALTDTILSQVIHNSSNGIITTSEISTETIKTLQNFDPLAASIYAAHHRLEIRIR